MRNPRIWLAVIGALILMWALAQQETQMDTVTVSESEQYGEYLTDFEGRTLYLFVDDAEAVRGMDGEGMTEGVREEAASCTGGCLENWPPLFGEIPDDGVSAGEGLNAELLYIADVDGREQVVYNGWPLFYFARDEAPGDINGQGAGDRWYIVSPEGWMIDEEGVAGGGQAEGAGDEEEAEEAEGADGAEGDAADDGAAEGDAGEDGAEGDAGEDGAEDGAEGDAADDGAADGAEGDDAADDGAEGDPGEGDAADEEPADGAGGDGADDDGMDDDGGMGDGDAGADDDEEAGQDSNY